MSQFLKRWSQLLQQIARLMVGLPDYQNYVEHMRRFHPGHAPMSQAEFFRNRQAARYRGSGGRCC